jgi:DNA replication protein DnaC
VLPRGRLGSVLIDLSIAAAGTGFRVCYTLDARRVNELVAVQLGGNLVRTTACCRRSSLVIVEEFGYMNLDRRDAELLFQVLTERDEKLSIAIAWIGSFSGWTKALAYPPGSAREHRPAHFQRNHH